MFLFYAHTIENEQAFFDEAEMRHCIQALRKKTGDEIRFTDGNGNYYTGHILNSGKKGFTTSILKTEKPQTHPTNQFHIGIAPTKNMDRFEWFLEKATEFGITSVTPLVCSNSERKKIRLDRLRKIMISSMKQSLRAYLPIINPLMSFKDFMDNAATGSNIERFIAHCRSEALPHLMHCYTAENNVVVLIGPEGDFSEEEINLAEEKGFRAISLGKQRLRTETAGIAAVHILNLKNDQYVS